MALFVQPQNGYSQRRWRTLLPKHEAEGRVSEGIKGAQKENKNAKKKVILIVIQYINIIYLCHVYGTRIYNIHHLFMHKQKHNNTQPIVN